ncbi:hypothetical protein B6N60_04288 [Richelia sinica FACHB-800]|uniref:Uncharacterized protein n=1 Tax=Richelia sinica FACHB-800 TaxID=1357546 RepID=A0A975TCM4_9NOST|nr:hypothetical protein B6N60_04288 [Richelia sinica FACHB-800]
MDIESNFAGKITLVERIFSNMQKHANSEAVNWVTLLC